MATPVTNRRSTTRPPLPATLVIDHMLTSLEHFAARVNGVIVEIGAYSGRDTSLITIEPGGVYMDHPDLPSTDIFGDLASNLRARGLEAYVTLHRGLSNEPSSIALARETLARRRTSIGTLCIDADSEVQRDLDLDLPLCGDGCILSIDDYGATGLHVKWQPTRAAVDALVAAGKALPLGVYGYGTWLGVYHPEGC